VRRVSLLLSAVVAILFVAPATAQAGTGVPPGLPRVVGAAGDSITRAYDASILTCFLRDCPQYSWSTGTSSSVNSELSRLQRAQPGIAMTASNVAKTGTKMADLSGQLAALPLSVQYVTVLMGANDLCTLTAAAMTAPDAFKASFTKALTDYFARDDDSFVFVSSIPNLKQLYDVLSPVSSARSTWRSFGICQSMLGASLDDGQRQLVVDRETLFNNALRDACATFDRCRWDNLATFSVSFARSDVSTLDYFHPSVAGQAKLAAAAMKAGYWPSL